MELTDDEQKILAKAKEYIENNKNTLIDKFILRKKPLKLGLFSFFMAGSPGAGKTEFTQNYLSSKIDRHDKDLRKILANTNITIEDVDNLFVKIDVDEIRDFLPQYKKTDRKYGEKGNAHVIQGAANKGLDILRKFCLENDISFLHDGTFSNYDTMKKIIKKSLSKGRVIHIYYIYLDPLAAWEFTKAREYLEGRNIIKEKFIDQYFKSRESVDRIKEIFGDRVNLNCIFKDKNNKVIDIALNQQSVANFLQTKHNKDLIREYSAEDLSKLLV